VGGEEGVWVVVLRQAMGWGAPGQRDGARRRRPRAAAGAPAMRPSGRAPPPAPPPRSTSLQPPPCPCPAPPRSPSGAYTELAAPWLTRASRQLTPPASRSAAARAPTQLALPAAARACGEPRRQASLHGRPAPPTPGRSPSRGRPQRCGGSRFCGGGRRGRGREGGMKRGCGRQKVGGPLCAAKPGGLRPCRLRHPPHARTAGYRPAGAASPAHLAALAAAHADDSAVDGRGNTVVHWRRGDAGGSRVQGGRRPGQRGRAGRGSRRCGGRSVTGVAREATGPTNPQPTPPHPCGRSWAACSLEGGRGGAGRARRQPKAALARTTN
jgi:hypothetical protein